MGTTVWAFHREERGELGCGRGVPGCSLNGSSPLQFQLWVLLGVADPNILLEDSYLRGFVWVTASSANRGSCTSSNTQTFIITCNEELFSASICP